MSLSALFVLRDESDANRLHAFLRSNWRALAAAGRPLAVSVAEHKAKRSNAANRYYWATLNEIAAGAWVDGKQYSADAWHCWFKGRFIGSEELPGGGSRPLSSASLNAEEFANYVQRVEQYATDELGVELAPA